MNRSDRQEGCHYPVHKDLMCPYLKIWVMGPSKSEKPDMGNPEYYTRDYQNKMGCQKRQNKMVFMTWGVGR